MLEVYFVLAGVAMPQIKASDKKNLIDFMLHDTKKPREVSSITTIESHRSAIVSKSIRSP